MLVSLFCKLAGLKVTLAVISLFTSYSAMSLSPPLLSPDVLVIYATCLFFQKTASCLFD